MPVENERKYVLRDPQAILDLFDQPGVPPRWGDLQQGYLPGGGRIRHEEDYTSSWISRCLFNFKIIGSDGKLVEIETQIDDDDFKNLWPLTQNRIRKKRHKVYDDEGNLWDIDVLLREDGTPYFAMAECEMDDPDQDAPETILAELAPHIIYEVPRERSKEFTNSKLADPAYAARLLEEVNGYERSPSS